jgi:hypothetical protein
MKTMILSLLIVSLFGLFFITSCSNSTKPIGPGRLRLFLTDSPAEFDQVNIVVTRVDVHSANMDSLSGWETVNNDTATYNLLALRNGANTILGDTTLDPGKYTQIRMYIGSGSSVIVDGVSHPLEISANNTIKLNHEFDIAPATIFLLTLDFDAARSIVQTGNGDYRLMPVIRIEANDSVGTISGAVLPAAAKADVRAFTGVDTVDAFCDTLSGTFELPIMPAGSYNLKIASPNLSYTDSTVTGVVVSRQQNTNIGTIVLNLIP